MGTEVATTTQEIADINVKWNEEDRKLIQNTVARNTTQSEFKLFLYTAMRYDLDPLIKEVWCVKYGNSPAAIFTGRDGFLAIAHRSGVFDGMDSGVKMIDSEIVGWCRVYRKDMSHPFYVEAYLKEYKGGPKTLWATKPRTMIQKVAESQCLRRAFNISGLYSPDEYYQSEQPPANNDYEYTVSQDDKEQEEYKQRVEEEKEEKQHEETVFESKPITTKQVKRMYALANNKPQNTIEGVIKEFGFEKPEDVDKAHYNEICNKIKDIQNKTTLDS